MPDAEIGRHSGGQFGCKSETVAGLKVQAPAEMNRALASLQAWQFAGLARGVERSADHFTGPCYVGILA